ncbi:MAG: hypothetical protein EOL87_02315 [Spartobacteria bacterium]|nr:hypothetical protein [Spartobacteria bacterium]
MHPALNHFTTSNYWQLYNRLPFHVRNTADKYFDLLKKNPKHPSLHLKQIGTLWSVRAGLHYRALGIDTPSEEKGILWIWIGSHAEYDRFVRNK